MYEQVRVVMLKFLVGDNNKYCICNLILHFWQINNMQ